MQTGFQKWLNCETQFLNLKLKKLFKGRGHSVLLEATLK